MTYRNDLRWFQPQHKVWLSSVTKTYLPGTYERVYDFNYEASREGRAGGRCLEREGMESGPVTLLRLGAGLG